MKNIAEKIDSMQQAKDPSKTHRLATLLRAQLGLSHLLQSKTIITAERAALELRSRPLEKTKTTAEKVVFLLPFVRRNHVSDWAKVTHNLNCTLNSFRAQTNPNWHAVICGQDTPNFKPDERIQFIHFEKPIQGHDKWGKLSVLLDHFLEQTHRDSYIMTFDADDLAHRNLVSYYLEQQAPHGYVMDHGVIHDIARNRFGQAGHRSLEFPLRKPFWKLCGSCVAFRCRPQEAPHIIPFLKRLTQHEHRMFPYLANLANRPLRPVLENLIMYEFNHGENFDHRLNQGKFKERFVKRFQIRGASQLDKIHSGFL